MTGPNRSNTPDYHVRLVSATGLTSLLSAMNKRQADMESLCRDCKREFDSEFGGGCSSVWCSD